MSKLRQELIPGEKHSRITVLEHGKFKFGGNVKCLCDCGEYFFARLNSIRKGEVRSCGCLRREKYGIPEIKPVKTITMKPLDDLEGDDIACDSIFRFITKMGMDDIKSYDNKLSLCKGSVCVHIFFDGRISCSHDFLQQVSVFELVALFSKLGYQPQIKTI